MEFSLAAGEARHQIQCNVATASNPSSDRRVKILVIEDQSRMGRFLKKFFEEHNHTVTWVKNCATARDALCETSYDLLVLDLTLPDGDGLDLLREWRQS